MSNGCNPLTRYIKCFFKEETLIWTTLPFRECWKYMSKKNLIMKGSDVNDFIKERLND